jgi:ATP/maltotriose-dependent transcriptional regulator MalT
MGGGSIRGITNLLVERRAVTRHHVHDSAVPENLAPALPSANESDAPSLPQDFAGWMAELDAMQALRARDPAGALTQALAMRGRWQHLPRAQDALLRARFGLQVAAAHLVLGDHEATRHESEALDKLLVHRDLLTADAEITRHAQRCNIAAGNVRAFLAHGVGDFAGALRAYLNALETARSIGERRYEAHLLVNLANTFEESGLAAQSLEHGRMALEIAAGLGMDELVGDIHHNIGNALGALGEHAQGLDSNRRALDAYATLKLPQKESYALVAVAERLLELGRHQEATDALRERAARTLDYRNRQYEAYAAYLEGRIAMADGDAARATAAFERALVVTEGVLGDRVGQARARLQLAKVESTAARPDAAWSQARQALELLQGSQAGRDEMQAHQLLSQLAKERGDHTLALEHHEAFHAAYARSFNEQSALQARVLAVRHEVELARADTQRERAENARLTDALADITARLRHPAAPHAAPPALPTSPEDLRALGLTPREAEVLFWVTQGKTNDDVTRILGASVSAVKKHLGRIYDKLGVDNRTAAADAVRRRGLSGVGQHRGS